MGIDVNYGGSLDPEREFALAEPSGEYRYAENYMLSCYDASADIGMWLHLGTCPDDFGLWEDQVLISLPENQGLLWMTSYHRTPPECRPGGGSLSFQCVSPFQRWRVEFDGVVVHSSNTEMMSGRVRDGVKRLLNFELDVACVAPVWDTRESAMASSGRGSMEDQSWANQHYQQLIRCRGELELNGRTVVLDAMGVRDHSRGQRGHAMQHYGGHNLFTAAFPSGAGFGLMSMWTPDGATTLSVAYVVDKGQLYHADILNAPVKIDRITLGGEPLEVVLRSAIGEHVITGVVERTVYATASDDWGMAFGADTREGNLILAPSFARWRVKGEETTGLAEKSNRF